MIDIHSDIFLKNYFKYFMPIIWLMPYLIVLLNKKLNINQDLLNQYLSYDKLIIQDLTFLFL